MYKGTFKKYLNESDSPDEKKIPDSASASDDNGSIKNLADHKPSEIMDLISDLTVYRVTEKLDGTSLRFGLDDQGSLYASRGSKGYDNRIYDPVEWGISGAQDTYRAAHLAIANNEEAIKSVLNAGEHVDVEVLINNQPNAIEYSFDGSYIVFLNHSSDDTKLESLASVCKPTNVSCPMTNTYDGVEIIEGSMTFNWQFQPVHVIDLESIDMNAINSVRNDLRKYLDTEISTPTGEKMKVIDILEMNLNKIPKEDREDFKIFRETERESFKNDHLESLKNAIIAIVTDSTRTQFEVADDYPIKVEGLVFANNDSSIRFKVLDGVGFQQLNKFYRKVREMVRTTINTTDPTFEIASRGGVYGVSKIRILKLLGIEGLDNPSSIKKNIINSFKGGNINETINNIASELEHNDLRTYRDKIVAIYSNAIDEILHILEEFKIDYQDYVLVLNDGSEIRYTLEIKRRTLLYIAEVISDLKELIGTFKKVQSWDEVVVIMYGKKIDDIFNESNEEVESNEPESNNQRGDE